jgi:CheY-like chemotaxis protein
VRILLVDDNQDHVEALRTLLEMDGHLVHSALDAHGALQHIERAQPDVAILDINLIGMDGFGLCRAIRKLSAAAVPLLIALSAHVEESYIREAESAGFDYYFSKDVRTETLLKAIRNQHKREP